jgi:hypothetical protein
MENKKYEQLIDLIINEQDEKARELFHEIVVEKSREIYESIMDEEMMDEGGQMHGQVADLMDEIDVEETGMNEEEEDIEFDSEEEVAEPSGDVPAADVADVKDDLEDVLAHLEGLLRGEAGDEDMGDEGEEVIASDEEEEAMMEAVQLQKVSVTHGDNGQNTKSPALHEPKVKTSGVKPVKFDQGGDESVPNGPKGPSNEYSKKEGDLPGAGKFKNAPGGKGAKLENAPKPKHGDDGANAKSPVAKG